MALPLTAPLAADHPDLDPARLAPQRIKRCTFRRLIQLDRAGGAPLRRRVPAARTAPADPLGDLDSAMPICNACTAAHIFRPDED